MIEHTLTFFSNLAILFLLFGPFIIRSVLEIRDIQRNGKATEPLDWRVDTFVSFRLLWNGFLVAVFTFLILCFCIKASLV